MIANGQTISMYTFKGILKVLNPNLRICAFENSTRLAGLYLYGDSLYEDICGVDKNRVPPYAKFDDAGHVVESGWRRTIWILYANGYTTREKVLRVCRGFFDYRACAADRFVGGIAGDPIDNKILKWQSQSETGELSAEQILELGQDIQKKDTAQQALDRDHDKWFLETWKKTGVKPNY